MQINANGGSILTQLLNNYPCDVRQKPYTTYNLVCFLSCGYLRNCMVSLVDRAVITFMYNILSGLFINVFSYLHVHNIVQFVFGCPLPPGTYHYCIVCFSRLSITIINIILRSLFFQIIDYLVHNVYSFARFFITYFIMHIVFIISQDFLLPYCM